jgi:hypothetical protein
MSEESISTVPSSQTKLGALTTGLIALKRSKWRKTETCWCSKAMPIRLSEMATRRT